MVIDPNGNVGVGTTNPTAMLDVGGIIQTESGINNGEFRIGGTGVLSATSGNLLSINGGGFNNVGINGNVGVGTNAPQAKLHIAGAGPNGYALGVEGNVTQNLANFGFAKAMLHVDQSGTIDRCFNSTIAGNGMTALPCGFSVSVLTTGIYAVDFRFPTGDRFVAVTAGTRTVNTIVPSIIYGDGNGGGPTLITVQISETSTGHLNLGSFTIIVY